MLPGKKYTYSLVLVLSISFRRDQQLLPEGTRRFQPSRIHSRSCRTVVGYFGGFFQLLPMPCCPCLGVQVWLKWTTRVVSENPTGASLQASAFILDTTRTKAGVKCRLRREGFGLRYYRDPEISSQSLSPSPPVIGAGRREARRWA
jgi:hypothetical protein